MSDRETVRIRLFAVPALILGLLIAAPAVAREVVSAPEDGGPGLSVLPEDNKGPVGPSAPERRLVDPPLGFEMETPPKYDDIGGDDLLLASGVSYSDGRLDIADDGTIYALAYFYESGVNGRLEVWRSSDDGITFSLWATHEPPLGQRYSMPDMQVIEGAVDVLMVVYTHQGPGDQTIELVTAPLGGASGTFGTPVTVMAEPGVDFSSARFDTDVTSFSSFYVYVVANGDDDTGVDIWFARSTDQGGSFESPYRIAELLVDDRAYGYPDISYGYGGHLHTVWQFTSDTGAFDRSVRYRRASGYAADGLADWDYWVTLTSTSDGYDDQYPMVHGGKASDDVVIAHSRINASAIFEDTRIFVSEDTGETFGPSLLMPAEIGRPGDFDEDPSTGLWALSGIFFSGFGVTTAHVSDLTDWSAERFFNDAISGSSYWYCPDVAIRTATDGRMAMVWTRAFALDTPDEIVFDAEWRTDPGIPNVEPGFPLGLFAPPLSPPALVDVDGDPELEIVFSDELWRIHVLNPDGSSVPGWPVEVGVELSDGPVAVGDLLGYGEPALVVGGTDGRVYAYDPTGALLPGWPAAVSDSDPGPVYVSIGALGPPYARSIVAACGRGVTIMDYRGRWRSGMAYGSAEIRSPVAIGDIDADGVAEFVYGTDYGLYAGTLGSGEAEFVTIVPSVLADALSLADLDLDGDLEILWPGENGVLYAYDHDGDPLGGNFPYDTGDVGPLTSAAVAHFRGGIEPDIAFAHRDWTVYALYHDGALISGYPASTSNFWFLWGAPIIAPVNGVPSEVIIGDRGDAAWAWTNAGAVVKGWPLDVVNQVNLSPAHGDIDGDGANELVLLTDTSVWVVDLASTPGADPYTWPMYGHDPQRTGCADCPEDATTAVDPVAGVTRVSFAGPSPNPVSGATSFAFAVPHRAAVDLEIVDLRGRRVYTVFREEMEAGERVVGWNGCDRGGRPVAGGVYFARLRVRGPGTDETQVRKLSVVR